MKVKIQIDIRKLIERNDLKTLKLLLQDQEPGTIFEMIEELEASEKIVVFRLLPKDLAAQVFSELEPDEQLEIIRLLKSDPVLREIVKNMEPDDRAELLDELPAPLVTMLLEMLTPEEREETLQILNYPENSAGRVMSPRFIYLEENMTADEALRKIRKFGKKAETIYTLYVVDNSRKLLGFVDLEDIIYAEPHVLIKEIANYNPVFVYTTDDQEEVAQIMRRYDLLVIPVIDKTGTLVGVITIDDVVDIIDEEATEDIQKMAGLNVTYTSYFHTPVLTFFGKRIPWLAILLLLESLSSFVVAHFQNLISMVPILAAFMTLMVGAAGNTGSQISALVIRGMALGEIKTKDFSKVLIRELFQGILLGVALGIILLMRGLLITSDLSVNIAATIALFVVILYANILGVILPFMGKILKIDPAVMAGPVITTVVDVTGMLIYFSIARAIIGI
ncbi:MAG: magnesium transporter [Thermotogaceae bacterium]|nr:magnesium transporter [Thermotogaceae bacterium]MDN5338867.1 magnesium transporter [Thermotogaceae bacterium]